MLRFALKYNFLVVSKTWSDLYYKAYVSRCDPCSWNDGDPALVAPSLCELVTWFLPSVHTSLIALWWVLNPLWSKMKVENWKGSQKDGRWLIFNCLNLLSSKRGTEKGTRVHFFGEMTPGSRSKRLGRVKLGRRRNQYEDVLPSWLSHKATGVILSWPSEQLMECFLGLSTWGWSVGSIYPSAVIPHWLFQRTLVPTHFGCLCVCDKWATLRVPRHWRIPTAESKRHYP